jgi:hypothetical protein
MLHLHYLKHLRKVVSGNLYLIFFVFRKTHLSCGTLISLTIYDIKAYPYEGSEHPSACKYLKCDVVPGC